MKRAQVRQILQIPNTPLVDFAVSLANLTPDEIESIILREREGLSIAEAAIASHMCESRHKRLYQAGMTKIGACWSHQPWLPAAQEVYRKLS